MLKLQHLSFKCLLGAEKNILVLINSHNLKNTTQNYKGN